MNYLADLLDRLCWRSPGVSFAVITAIVMVRGYKDLRLMFSRSGRAGDARS